MRKTHYITVPHSAVLVKFTDHPVFVMSRGIKYAYDGRNWWDLKKMRPGARPEISTF